MKRDVRYQEIDVARFLCNILVVQVHAYPFMYGVSGGEYRFWTFYCMDFARSILPALSLLSGYLFFLHLGNNVSKSLRGADQHWMDNFVCDYLAKLLRRIKRLLVPFILWNLIFVFLYLITGQFSCRAYGHVQHLKLDTLIGVLRQILPFMSGDAPIDSPMWFVQLLILFAIISPILFIVWRCGKWIGLMLGVIFFAWLKWKTTLLLWAEPAPVYAFSCYALGGGLAMSDVDIIAFFRKNQHRCLLVGVVAIVLCAIFRSRGAWRLYETSFIFTAAFVWSLAPLLARWLNGGFFLRNILPSGFFVYASHFFFNSVFMHIIGALIVKRIGFTGLGSMTIIAIATQLCVFVVTITLWNALRRKVPRFVDLLEGKLNYGLDFVNKRGVVCK